MAPKKSLVVVESPAKARTINRYLGKGFVVKASMGHVRDLPKRELGVDVEKGFKPSYVLIKDRKDVIAQLKKAAANADAVYLATDPDREGEAIGWHVAEVLKNGKKFYRVSFQEITRNAVTHAFKHPQKLDHHKIEAQQARRILDRLVGYKISPLLWRKVRRGLSAGRVQSVALRMIVEREREIEAFKVEEYWTIHAALEAKPGETFEAQAHRFRGEKLKIANEAQARDAAAAIRRETIRVEEVKSRERRTVPSPPFITSTLQQEAAKRLRLPVRRTMSVAQRLYEGVELPDEGGVGLITYMRTDSPRVSEGALQGVRSFIEERYGKQYVSRAPRRYKARRAAQEGHEAIRPTDVRRTPQSLKAHLKADDYRLYRLVWERFVASQMAAARYDATKASISAGDYLLRAEGSVLRFDGFMKVHPPVKEKDDFVLPPLERGQTLALKDITPKQHFTQPPPRYTEATLVKALEANGIGRPSTYAAIITTIQGRDYVGREEGKFKPTELGCLVTDKLLGQFTDLMDVGYTARMEEELDKIEDGDLDWVELLEGFYKKFSRDLAKAEKGMTKAVEETDEVCETCGAKMLIRFGRFGKFLSCSAYPECKNTKELPGAEGEDEAPASEETPTCQNCGKAMKLRSGRYGKFYACTGYPECKTTVPLAGAGRPAAPPKELDEACPKCGKKLVERMGRFGGFVSCSGYPKCKYIKPKTVGVPCPEEGCGGELAERTSKRGPFYSCTNYPKCRFIVNYRPVPEVCPKCSAPFLLTKETKKEGKVKFCGEKKCKYKKKLK
ncbi:MAG: type I DNA topoisomerase [Acidobacteriota bacterium]|nr:MAG: type I DNA topoisomerase [Acidobacteriota bacterium]